MLDQSFSSQHRGRGGGGKDGGREYGAGSATPLPSASASVTGGITQEFGRSATFQRQGGSQYRPQSRPSGLRYQPSNPNYGLRGPQLRLSQVEPPHRQYRPDAFHLYQQQQSFAMSQPPQHQYSQQQPFAMSQPPQQSSAIRKLDFNSSAVEPPIPRAPRIQVPDVQQQYKKAPQNFTKSLSFIPRPAQEKAYGEESPAQEKAYGEESPVKVSSQRFDDQLEKTLAANPVYRELLVNGQFKKESVLDQGSVLDKAMKEMDEKRAKTMEKRHKIRHERVARVEGSLWEVISAANKAMLDLGRRRELANATI